MPAATTIVARIIQIGETFRKATHSRDDFAWGEKKPKDSYSWTTYQLCEGEYNKLTKYCSDRSYGNNGFTDNLTTLESGDDAATANWGEKWRMPTDSEWAWLISTKEDEEIKENYEWTWCNGTDVKYNGTSVAGWKIVRKSTGATLFLPAAGYQGDFGLYDGGSGGDYWSSSLDTDDPDSAWYVYFYSGHVYRLNDYRHIGYSVRPVTE